MTLTKKGEYGLRAIIQLGIAEALGREIVPVSELAETNRLPLKFVERILFELRGAGYVETRRGKMGGYALARPASEIKMGEIVRLIDGKLAPIACASETAYERCTCPDEEHCGLRMLMIDVRNAISNILDRYTLGDVVQVTLRKLQRDNKPMPFSCSKTTAGPTRRRVADPAQGFLSALGIEIATAETDRPSPRAEPATKRASRGK